MNNNPKSYKSSILDELNSKTSKEELDLVESKMRLAIKIADAIKKCGYKNKSDFAKKLKKQNSEISKWLSGTHNFTHDTLILLQNELNIKLVDSEVCEKIGIKKISINTKTINQKNSFNIYKIFSAHKPDYIKSYSYASI